MKKFKNILLIPILFNDIINGTIITGIDLILEDQLPNFDIVFLFKDNEQKTKFLYNYSYIFNMMQKEISFFVMSDIIYAQNIVCPTFSIIKHIKKLKIFYKKLHIILSTSYIENRKNVDYINYIESHDIYFYGLNFYRDYIINNFKVFRPLLSKTRIENIRKLFIIEKNKNWNVSLEKYHNIDYRKQFLSSENIYYNRFYWLQSENIYFEGIGKSIFESVLLGKNVFYSKANKCINDGLTEYLKFFLNIDDNYDKLLKNCIFKNDIYYNNNKKFESVIC